MIILAPAEHEKRPVTKCWTSDCQRSTQGPEGLLARMVGFSRSGAAMHAHRYGVEIGDQSGTTCLAPSGGGMLSRDITVPFDAVYVVWSWNTPIAWVTSDGTVTVPDVYYSPTTTMHQNQCRAWLGAAVQGTSTHTHHVAQGYRTA